MPNHHLLELEPTAPWVKKSAWFRSIRGLGRRLSGLGEQVNDSELLDLFTGDQAAGLVPSESGGGGARSFLQNGVKVSSHSSGCESVEGHPGRHAPGDPRTQRSGFRSEPSRG